MTPTADRFMFLRTNTLKILFFIFYGNQETFDFQHKSR